MIRESTKPSEGTHRLPGLAPKTKRTYDALLHIGATGPASAKDVKAISKRLHENKHEVEHELHALEGKGIVGHQSNGHDTLWFARK